MPIINGQLLETIDITQNGRYDIAKYTLANVNVKGGGDINIESLNITPTTSEQIINPTSEIDGYAPIHVNAVTSSIDSDIKPENIKSGVNILGVVGNYIGESKGYLIDNEGNFVSLLQNYLDSGKTNPIDLSEIKHITNYSFNFLYDSFCDRNRFSLGKPPRVNLSNLETITGTYSCRNAFSNNNHFWNNKQHGIGNVNMGKLTSIDGNYTCLNMFEGSFFRSLDLSSLTSISGSYACYNMFKSGRYVYEEVEPVESDSSESDSGLSELPEDFDWEKWEREYQLLQEPGVLSFPSLTTIKGENTCQDMFSDFGIINDHWQCVPDSGIKFPSLETIDGELTRATFAKAFSDVSVDFVEFSNLKSLSNGAFSIFENAFNSSYSLKEVRFPSLAVIDGHYNFSRAFQGLTNPTDPNYFYEMRFPSLFAIYGHDNFTSAFVGCTNLRDIYFDSLNYIESRNFIDMLLGLDGVTLHFPSNLNPSTISSLVGYPNFGGTNTLIVFDL